MRKIIKWGILMILILIIIVFGTNFFVKISTRNLIVDNNSKKIENADCALVLGAGIWNNEPSPMLNGSCWNFYI